MCATEEWCLLKWKEPEGHGEETKRQAAFCKTKRQRIPGLQGNPQKARAQMDFPEDLLGEGGLLAACL